MTARAQAAVRSAAGSERAVNTTRAVTTTERASDATHPPTLLPSLSQVTWRSHLAEHLLHFGLPQLRPGKLPRRCRLGSLAPPQPPRLRLAQRHSTIRSTVRRATCLAARLGGQPGCSRVLARTRRGGLQGLGGCGEVSQGGQVSQGVGWRGDM